MLRTTAARHVVKVKDYDHLCVTAAQKILEISKDKITEQGRCSVVLSGGLTPQGLYASMAAAYRDQLDWKRIHFFMLDERCVSTDSPRSNYKMIELSGMPTINVHRIKTDVEDPRKAAELYEREIKDFFNLETGELPHFDLVLLGLGEDGHVASLFPGHPALKEKDSFVVAVKAAKVPEKRVTLTLSVINNAAQVIFLVSGPSKAGILKKVLLEERQSFPAAHVHPAHGELWWFIDQMAASLLRRRF